jgi:UDP-N-acetylmuramyl tripeptide synthase
MKKTLALIDSRRLTGKNLLMDVPAAVIDVVVEGYDKFQIVTLWQQCVTQLQQPLAWQHFPSSYRIYDEGLSLAVAAPIDALYAAAELNEAAWAMVEETFKNTIVSLEQETQAASVDENVIAMLESAIAEESNPLLMSLINAAKQKQVPYLWDDDEFSLGFGASAKTWNITELPAISEIDWQRYSAIPVVYVTGTNGKSTTVRILSEIFKESGKNCGVTSTDFIRVGERIIDQGDYSGPGGARMLLRHNDVEVAVLEVARGGLLRRGLPIPNVDGAIITNIAEDHLGQYGINDLASLAQAKFLVAKGLTSDKPLVLNADDTEIVNYQKTFAKQLPDNICWFSVDEAHPLLQQQRLANKALCYEKIGFLYFEQATRIEKIVSVNSIPMTLQGAARHNVLNALGAIGLARSLGVEVEYIVNALQNFKSDGQDNPGRGNFYQLKGATVVVDFAHNVHSMQAMANTLKALPAKRKWLMLGHAGDRSDLEISNLTQCIMDIQPDLLMVVENPEYLRGRELGEIPQLITRSARECGMAEENIFYANSPTKGTEEIINTLESEDLVFLMVLSEREAVVQLLESE